MEKQTANPMALLKDNLLKATKDKLAKMQHEDMTSEHPKQEKTVDHLSLFKNDISRFKDDLSSVFTFGLSVEKERKKDSRANLPVMRDEGNSKSLRKEEQLDCGFRETLSQQSNDKSTGNRPSQPEHRQLDPCASEQVYKTQDRQEMLSPGKATGISCHTTGFNHLKSALTTDLETLLQEEDLCNKDTDAKTKDHKRTEAAEDWLKVVKDKDKSLRQTSTQAEKKTSVLRLLREDVAQSAETALSHLSHLTVEFNQFRFKLPKEKDKDDASKLKLLKTVGTDMSHMSNRDHRACISAANRGEVKVALSERKEEQLDCCSGQNLSEQNKEKSERSNNKVSTHEAENSDLDINRSQGKSEARFCETQKSDGMTDGSGSSGSSGTTEPQGLIHTLFRRDQHPVKGEQLDHGFRENQSQGDRPDQGELDASEHKPEAGETMSRGKAAELVEQASSSDSHRESESGLRGDELGPTRDQRDLVQQRRMGKDQLVNHEAKKTISSLTLLKEDFHHFRDDLLNVFRIRLSKEKENKGDSSSVQALNADRSKEFPGRKEKPDFGRRINFPEQNKETFITETMNIMTDPNRTDPPDGSKHTVRLCAANEQKVQTEGDRPWERLPWDSSGISLLSAGVGTGREQLGEDVWSPKNFATYLTFDPNTANSELRLTDGNRKVTRVWSDYGPWDHPERFLHCPQVLCREGLLDSVYWEVEWSGGADIGIAYNSISRDGDTRSCLLGHNRQSWSLECSEGSYTPTHNSRRFRSVSPEPFTRRVGLYLDWSAGTLSFYCVSQETMVHLHTFTSTFTEPLYAAFWIWACEGSASLCQVQLEWERLQ